MKRFLAVLLVCCGTASAAGPANSDAILTPDGLGPVNIGMTLNQVEHALGQPLDVNYEASGNESCGTATPKNDVVGDVSYMVENSRVTRIDINLYNSGPDKSTIRTAAGIGLGSSEAEAMRAYGGKLRIEPHPYVPDGHYLIVDTPDHKRAIIFETDRGKVTSFRAGEYPAVAYIEGCA